VFYCRTTQPQTIMHLETDSNVYGLTVNPYNRNLTPGGSSGGEGALIGMRGSLVVCLQPIIINLTSFSNASRESVATSAAAFVVQQLTAVSMLSSEFKTATQQSQPVLTRTRPTNKRLTSLGIRGHMSGKEAMMSTPGPMTTDRETLEIIMKAALASEPWRLDPAVTFKPWTPVTFTKPLKIAVQWWDGVVTPHPPMRRALREVAEACRKAGMKVFDWNCEKLDHRKGWEIISSLYWPDGGEQVLNSLKETGEPVLPLSKWIIQEQPSVKNLTQQELWDVSVYHLICRSTTSQQLTNNPSAPPKEKPTAPPTHKPGPPPPTQTETGKKWT
jgi:amidase